MYKSHINCYDCVRLPNISWRGVVNIFIFIPSLVGLVGLVICMNLHHFASASKSKTISFVSSVPFRDPTAHTWGAEQSCNWKSSRYWRKRRRWLGNSSHQLGWGRTDSPDDSSGASRLQSNQVADEVTCSQVRERTNLKAFLSRSRAEYTTYVWLLGLVTCLDVPELHGAVIATCDDELGIELKASHSRLMFVRAWGWEYH